MARRHHRRYMHNPLGSGWGATLTEGLAVLAGLLGSKYLTQLVLGGSNTGVIGYVGNLAVGGVGGWAAAKVMKQPRIGQSFFVGSVIEVIIRVLEDYTPFGTYLQQTGMGDYFAQNFAFPQQLSNGLVNAEIDVPQGWGAPALVMASNAAPAGAVAQLAAGKTSKDGMY